MDGDGAPGSGATPGPGTTTGSGPPPAPGPGSATSPPDLETEWFGLAVDSAEQGGLNPHVAHPGGAAPSSATPPTLDDVAAYVGLLELSQPTPPLPGDGPVGSVRRLRRLTVATALVGGSAAFLLILAVLAARPGGTPATGAGGPAVPVQQGDVVPPSVDEAKPSAGGGGGDAQPGAGGAVIPTSCLVPEGGALDLELTDVTWTQETDGLSFSWRVLIHNRGSDTFSVFLHDVAGANAASRAQFGADPTEWQTSGGNMVDPDGTVLPNGNALPINSESGGGRTSVEPGLPTFCSWGYVDRLVAVYSGPECRDDLWTQLKAAPDAAAREALLGPLAVDMPIPDEMKTFSCPE